MWVFTPYHLRLNCLPCKCLNPSKTLSCFLGTCLAISDFLSQVHALLPLTAFRYMPCCLSQPPGTCLAASHCLQVHALLPLTAFRYMPHCLQAHALLPHCLQVHALPSLTSFLGYMPCCLSLPSGTCLAASHLTAFRYMPCCLSLPSGTCLAASHCPGLPCPVEDP